MSNHMKSYFSDFLKEIRLTENQVSELKNAHETLRKRLKEDEDLKDIIVDTFLQGSYKRATAVRPKGESRSDVDIIIVTNIDKETVTSNEALNLFEDFLEKYYKGKYRKQGRSWGIEMSKVDLDIVPTSAPSEIVVESLNNVLIKSSDDIFILTEDLNTNYITRANYASLINNNEEEWKNEPLYIPDRNADVWEKTHPLEQIRWTIEKNKDCNGHYINVVKALKWWRKEKHPDVSHPKSYPLEHFIGDCCPDEIESVAEGIVKTLETIKNEYTYKPFLPDRGVPDHDVFSRLTEEEYNEFYKTVEDAYEIAKEAFETENISEAAELWRELFGGKFPKGPGNNGNSKLTKRTEVTENLSGGRFA